MRVVNVLFNLGKYADYELLVYWSGVAIKQGF